MVGRWGSVFQRIGYVFVLGLLIGRADGAVRAPSELVNPFVGTTAGGNMFPGPDYPFGMIQWGPDTAPDRPAGGGYEYTAKNIRGFSLTHASGIGCYAFNDVPVLPMVGALPGGDPAEHVEPFTHDKEVGTAGYYAVSSGAHSEIRTELTTTLRSAMARFRFPATKQAAFLLKFLDGQMNISAATAAIVGDREVTGSITSGGFCGSTDKHTVYFDIVFDRAFTASQLLNAANGMPNVAFLTFDTTSNQVIQAKAAISFVSVENARANWRAENGEGHWDFESVRNGVKTAWNTMLSKIEIDGGTATEQELFYTSLYHSLLHPNVFSDVNGEYMGFDNKVHAVSGQQKAQYANYSGWDIYHGQAQLSALMAPQEMSDSAQSMINDAAQNGGQIPKWSLANAETYIMVGDPADGILAGYYAFGARAFDTQAALAAMVHQGKVETNIRPGLKYLDTLGYLPEDGTYGCCDFYGSVGTLLEYNEADYAISQFASALGDQANASFFLRRAQTWQNAFDPATGFFSPRLLNGAFVDGITLTSSLGMVEGSASQYRWIIPFNRRAQINAFGGFAKVNAELDAFFTKLDDNDGFGALIANEFQIGSQYWYNYTGQPWKTQEVVNRIRTQLFADKPLFIDNNDDLGAMSAQLVWSMLGVFPTIPGSAILAVNGPQFPSARVHLPSGALLTLKGEGASAAAPYVQSMMVNGRASNSVELDASVIETGGELAFRMGAAPNRSWGSAPSESPELLETTTAIAFASPSQIIVAPGNPATVTIGVQSTRDDVAQAVSWSARPSAQVTLSQSSGNLQLERSAKALQKLTLQLPATPGWYDVTFHFTSSTGITMPDVAVRVAVAEPNALWPYYNRNGITHDGGTVTGSLDREGFTYSADALAAAGVRAGAKIRAGGMEFTWPALSPGKLNSILLNGQTLALTGNGPQRQIGLLGCATDAVGGEASGVMTVHYADGSKQDIPVAFNDWTFDGTAHALPSGTSIVATMPYRNSGTGRRDNRQMYLFAFTAALTSSQPVTGISFPGATAGGQINVFDVELQ